MARRDAREVAMKLFYQKDLIGESNIDSLLEMETGCSIGKGDLEYVHYLLKQIHEQSLQVDHYIENFAKGWSLHRIAKVDLAILRLAICELLFCDDIPTSVSINEAIELAKKYSGEKAGTFINGILGNLVRSMGSNVGDKQI